MTERIFLTVVALNLCAAVTGFFLGMGYTAWVFEHTFGTYFSLFCSCITGWAWFIIWRDLKDLTDA